MSDKELGRPSYKAPAAKPPSAGVPPQPRGGAANPDPAKGGSRAADGPGVRNAGFGRRSRKTPDTPDATGPRPPWAEPPGAEPADKPELPRKAKAARKPQDEPPAKKKAKPPETAPEAARTVYVPVRQNRGAGYALWAVLRFIVLAVGKLVLTLVKIALSPFHAMGGWG